MSVCRPTWITEVMNGYFQDEHAQKLLTELAVDPSQNHHYSLQDGLIRYKGRLWIGHNTKVQNSILTALHSSGLGGHSGITATYNRIKSLFAWPNMKNQIEAFVQQCTVCQQAKVEHVKLPVLLQPLPVPEQAWSVVSLDFIEGLPKSQQYDTILVVIDKFSKYGHFIPLAHPFTAPQIAHLFLANVYKLHGMPTVIISDRDRIFTSTFWQELFKATDTTLSMSSSYHPQTDGQTERLNQCLETYLRCFIHSCTSKWSQWLPLAEFWYNTSYHSALGKTPFMVLYGQEPRQLGIRTVTSTPASDVDEWLSQRNLMTQLIQQQLQRAQQRMKHQADKGRSEREFQIGDWVFLKLQPYVQMSVANRTNQKLSFKYFGPYLITDKIGAVAYKLQLPAGSRIHPVIHVSMLKKAVPQEAQVSIDIPPACNPETDMIAQPEQFLERRLVRTGDKVIMRVLVKWKGLAKSLATWEDLSLMHERFPDTLAWGQAISYGGGDVTTQATPAVEEELGRGKRIKKPVKKLNL